MQPLYFVVEMNYSTHELYATRTHRIMALTQDDNAAHTLVRDEEIKRKQIVETINKRQRGQVQIIHPKRPTDKLTNQWCFMSWSQVMKSGLHPKTNKSL